MCLDADVVNKPIFTKELRYIFTWGKSSRLIFLKRLMLNTDCVTASSVNMF